MKMDLKQRLRRGLGRGRSSCCSAEGAGGRFPPETGQAASVPEEVTTMAACPRTPGGVGQPSAVFRLYDALTGGNLLWQQSATLVADGGLFNVSLALSTSALSGGGARYLEIEVETSVLSPRELLGAQPYALVAKTVEGSLEISGGGLIVSSAAASETLLSVSSQTGRVGVGTSDPAYQLDVQGDVRSTGTLLSPALYAVGGSLSGASFSVGGTALTVGAAGVGVGTASPDQRLSVAGMSASPDPGFPAEPAPAFCGARSARSAAPFPG